MRQLCRIDEILTMLQAFALGEVDLPRERLVAALALLDLGVDDMPPPDGDGEEASPAPDDQAVLLFPSKLAA